MQGKPGHACTSPQSPWQLHSAVHRRRAWHLGGLLRQSPSFQVMHRPWAPELCCCTHSMDRKPE